MIARTPHRSAHASLIQLRPSSYENKENHRGDSSPRTPVSTASNPSQSTPFTINEVKSARKTFAFSPETLSPKCQLDKEMRKRRDDGPEVAKVENQLHAIRERLASGAGCAVGERDASNVWIQSSLGALLCSPPAPEE
jgi:hypothetical protein